MTLLSSIPKDLATDQLEDIVTNFSETFMLADSGGTGEGKGEGAWSAQTQKDKPSLHIQPFVELGSDLCRHVEEEAEAYADYLGSSSGAVMPRSKS